MTLANEYWFGASEGFYNGIATQSLKFDRASSSYCIRQNSTATDSQKWTLSVWIKRATLGAEAGILGSSTTAEYVRFESNDTIRYRLFTGGSQRISMITNASFRDVANYFHFVCAVDLSNTTDNDKVIMYANGTRLTLGTNTTTSTDTYDSLMNDNSAYWNLGRYTGYYGGYMSDVHIIDGQQLTPSSFAETKNGLWIAKEYTGTYGNNGARLEFKQTGTSSASSSTIGADTSGNNNHFDANNVSAHDSNMPDCPENYFAVLNNIIRPYEVTPAETVTDGNLNAYFNSSGVSGSYWSTFFLTSGKWYFEVNVIAIGGNADVGISNKPSFAGRGTYTGDARGNGYFYQKDGQKGIDNTFSSYGATYTTGDIIGCAFDLDNNTITFYKNNSSQGQITGVTTTEDGYIPAIEGFNGTRLIANFGQDSTFNGNETAQGNTDSNNQGDFYYTPPSGYLALCSANLPNTTLAPNQDEQADDYFKSVLYTGNGSTTQNINIGFNPDWVWIKSRSNGSGHHSLIDSSRGDLAMNSNQTIAEYSVAEFNFKTDNTIDVPYYANDYSMNTNSATYVAWNWKAGGNAPTKTYKVVVVSDSGNKYRFRNSADSATFAQSAVTLDLQEGGTYTFDLSDSSMSGHPFVFSTTSNGTHGGGSEYTTGVTKTGTAGNAGATIVITVAASAPTLYYYCSNHSGMGGQINTNSTHGSTNFDGEVLSITQVSSEAGFSIATFTGSSASNSTFSVGHGLGSIPKMIIAKQRNLASGWSIYHHKIDSSPQGYYILLNSLAAKVSSSTAWGNTAPTSTAFSTYTTGFWGTSAQIVAYCFDEVEGYSKFGTYTGNGSTDGTFVFTGFRPAFVLLKRTTGSFHWVLMDSANDPINPIDSALLPAGTNASGTGYTVDFLSNGFKLRLTGTAMNASGEPHIYMAFAEQPFKFNNAR